MRRAAKRDASEKLIVAALRQHGWSVEFLSLPDGPDLLIGKGGETHLVEVKTGKKPLRKGQVLWHCQWRGASVVVLRTAADVEALNNSQWV